MRILLWVALLALIELGSACQSNHEGVLAGGSQALISDGAHNGNAHFFFLPPVARSPTPSGTFDGSLAPEVRICTLDLARGQCAGGAPLWSTADGSGSHALLVDAASEKYAVNLSTTDLPPGIAAVRVEVFVGQQRLGFADIEIVDGGRALKNVNTAEFIGLIDGRVLPIKFRIEKGALGIPIVLNLQPYFAGWTAGSGWADFVGPRDFPHLAWECTLNGVAVPGCSSPLPWQALTNGSTLTVEVTAIDLDTGTRSAPAVVKARVDAAVPTLTDISVLQLATPPRTVAFSFTSSDSVTDGTTFSCAIDGNSLPCAPGTEVVVSADFLSDGPHLLSIRASDTVFNSASEQVWFSVDLSPPEFDPWMTVVPPSAVCPVSTPVTEIRFGALDDSLPVSYACSLLRPNGEITLFATCDGITPTDPVYRWTALPNGQYTLYVLASDLFSNVSDPLVITFTVDAQQDRDGDGVSDCP